MSEQEHQRTVLLAEDDGFQRLTVENVLQMCGYAVIAVENGKLAMDELINEENDIDLVLLDRFMPEMDGAEVLCAMGENTRLS